MAEQFPHHESIHLKNVTAFSECRLDFVPTINVLVGENGTGKTHLMKALCAVQYGYLPRRKPSVPAVLTNMFAVDGVGDLIRFGNRPVQSSVEGVWGAKRWYAHWRPSGIVDTNATLELNVTRPVFIPAIDMLGHTRRFVSTYDEYQIDFDQTHRDIVALLLSPERRKQTEPNGLEELLISIMGGTVEEEAERFYLRTSQGRLPMPLVGEGIRKVATLYQLIRNGLLGPGSVLFWDEPEVNVNPKLMDEIVDVLLRLSRTGVQIFLATHSYVLLKEFDLQARTEDNVRYFGLESTENGTVAHATDDYSQRHPNPIAEQFDSLYDRQLDRSLGRKRKS